MKKILKGCLLKSISVLKRDVGPKIVFYHDIHGQKIYTGMGTPLALFKQHIDIARKNGFTFVNDIPQKPREVMIALDDGFRGIWDVREFFFREGLSPVVFLPVSLIGKQGYLTLPEVKFLAAHGFRFEGHTISHGPLTSLTGQDLLFEVAEARKRLAQELGRPVTWFCFPQGKFTDEAYKVSIAAGYDLLFSSVPGNADDFLMPRCVRRNLVQSSDANEYLAILSGGMNPFWRHFYKQHYRSGK